MKRIFSIVAACLAMLMVAARSADQTWDNGAADGIWSTSAANWDSGAVWSNGNNAIFGATGAGTVNVDGALNVKDITFNANGYEIADTGVAGTLTLESGNTITVGTGLSAIISESLSGASGLTKAGVGTLTLAGTNGSVNGGTVVSAGILRFGNENNNLPGGTVTVQSGGTVDLSALAGGNSTETGGSSRSYVISGAGSAGQGALVNDGGSLYNDAAITGFTLAGDATVSTNFRLDVGSGGSIDLGNYTLTKMGSSSLPFRSAVNNPNAALVLDAGGIYIESADMTVASITVNDGAWFGIYNGNGSAGRTVTAAVTLNGSSSLRQGSAGTPASPNNYAGTILVNGGTATLSTGVLNSSSDITFGSVISGSGTLVIDGTQQATTGALHTVRFNAANPFSGEVRMIDEGTFALGHADALQNATLDTSTATANSLLDFTSLTSTTFGGLKGDSGFALENASSAAVALTVGNNDQSTSFSGALTGSGSLTKTGTGTLTLGGANTYTGTTTVSEGALALAGGAAIADTGAVELANAAGVTLQLNASETIGSLSGGAGGIVNLGSNSLTVGNSNDTTVDAQFTGVGGSLVKTGTGTLILTAANNGATGTTTVQAGVLKFGNENNNLPSGTVTVQTGATVDLTALAGNNSTETGGSNRNYIIAGTGSAGQGALVNNSGSLIGGAAISGFTLAGDATINTGARLDIAGAIDLGNYSLTKIGGDWLPFRSAVNSPNAALVVDAGVSYIENANMTIGSITVNNGAVFGIYNGDGNSGRTVTADITLNGTSYLRQGSAGTPASPNSYAGTILINGGTATLSTGGLNSSSDITFDSIVSGSGTLVIDGTQQRNTGALHTVRFNAANTFSGEVRMIDEGTFQLGHTDALQNATLDTSTATANSTLDFTSLTSATFGGLKGDSGFALENGSSAAVALSVGNNDQDTTFSGVLEGAGSLTKIGSGTLDLFGDNTYTGTTTVKGGTLIIDGNQSTATGDVIVGNGATLGGSGNVGGSTTIETGGTLSPGNSPGVQTYAAGLTMNTGSTFTWELVGDTTSGRGTSFDGVDVTGGSLTLENGVDFNFIFNGTGSTVDFTSAFWESNQSWLLFDNANAPSLNSATVFDLGTISADASGALLSTVNPLGRFSFSQTGNDIYLNYTAVPEPATTGLLALLLGGWLAFFRPRRNWKG